MKKFIVVVDTQVDFMIPQSNLYVKGSENIINGLGNYLLNLNPEEVSGVLFTYDTHGEEYHDSEEAKQFPLHCQKGTFGWTNVYDGITRNIGVPVYSVEKGVFDMWEEKNLIIHRGIIPIASRDNFFGSNVSTDNEIIIVGVAADYCVKWAVNGFVNRGYKVTVLSEFTQGINQSVREALSGPEYQDVTII